jgi:hypothetical protein
MGFSVFIVENTEAALMLHCGEDFSYDPGRMPVTRAGRAK